ncbi:MAG: hypothetical protein ACTSX6_13570 [Candidatus Heimdallarchaeaceae archaeon]
MNGRSYREFLKTEYLYRKESYYERICNILAKVFKFPLPKSLVKKYQGEIEFCHLKVTPNGILATSIFIPLIVSIFLYLIFYLTGYLSSLMIGMLIALGAVLFYYFFSYTRFLTIYYRSKASSEMALSIIYMAISLRITENLESAVAFTAQNLSGPLGLDFKKLLWDLEVGRLTNVGEGLDLIAEKWRSESEEFVDALIMLKNSVSEPPEQARRSVEEAVDLILLGTKNRMKRYALKMRSPLRILNAFGILLPMLGMIFIPVFVMFVPELSKPELIGFAYMTLIPSILYIFLKQYFYTKPYSYHQVEIKNTKKFKRRKLFLKIFLILMSLSLLTFFGSKLIAPQSVFSHEQFLYSLAIILTIGVSIIFYSFFSILGFTKKNEEVIKMESELPVVLFQFGMVSGSGRPFEKNVEALMPRLREMKINVFFKRIIHNIRALGVSLEKAIFDKEFGALKDYPSKILSITMKLIIDIAKRGMFFLSESLKSMSNFLKDADEVNRAADEILSEVTSDMQVQAWVFAPLSAGIVVGMMAIVLYIFAFFGQSMQNVDQFFNQTGMGPTGFQTFFFLFKGGTQIPFPFFQLVIGVYMIEVVYMLANFLGELTYGEDEINKLMNKGKIMLLAILIYTATVCGLYFGVSSFMNFSAIGG